MARNRKDNRPTAKYSVVTKKGREYYRSRLLDADGKWIDIYGKDPDELYQKVSQAERMIEQTKNRLQNPTVEEYSLKWLKMHSMHISDATLRGYEFTVRKFIIEPLGDKYMSEVTADDIKLAMVPVSKKSMDLYNKVNMLFKCIFYSAEYSNLIDYNPSKKINAKGGVPRKEKEPLTDKQVEILLDTVKGLPPYLFVMLGLYSGLRREEILALKWDCVFLDDAVPYISVRRAWRSVHNRPVISEELKTKAAFRDVPIPKVLSDCLRQERESSISEYVIADSEGEPLSESQFMRVWNYIKVRSTKERTLYKYVNGQSIKKTVKPELGQCCHNRPDIVYTIDFNVTPHLLRHTYITNLIHAGVDPKTVQYLAGHENSKTTMDIYAKVKYNRPEQLIGVVNTALKPAACNARP